MRKKISLLMSRIVSHLSPGRSGPADENHGIDHSVGITELAV
jgi:hypothetical protein